MHLTLIEINILGSVKGMDEPKQTARLDRKVKIYHGKEHRNS